ncbi:WD40/YVTN/BNR-like repeat-containing protein [Candidatus Halobonum tyrrellensis]|uniref:Uncharacterized protein n=1 Tax=Candidatus Halobonum tyrrellensis G22 TaxID=1324957 RepID=V4HBL1_9EURY|nr:hypothetical protein [Candidatus Halobonum tyrrellensis]ESP87433.1 hypothetical protein K933_14198 [Candidatus Halobonum tyrrellensis G22]
MTEAHGDGGFVAFFRRYAKTWYHTVATAALTLFGTLTFVDRLFAVVAVAAYLLPPVVLYLTDSLPAADGSSAGTATSAADDADTGRHRSGVDGGRPVERSERTDDPGSTSSADPAASAGTTGSTGANGAGGSGETEPSPEWTAADAPTDDPLFDAAVTDAGAYAVGGGGTLLAAARDGWETLLSDGPGAAGTTLTGVAATGGAVWVAGESGAVGRVDPKTGRHADHSAPDGDTTNLAGVAAADDGGGELVLVVDGSGRIRRGRFRDGGVTWGDPVTPGSGSSVTGATLRDASTGYVCDSNDGVFATDDGGASFDRVGVDSADGTLADVAATADGCLVAADDGTVHRYDGSNWTPVGVADGALWAVAASGGRGLAAGGWRPATAARCTNARPAPPTGSGRTRSRRSRSAGRRSAPPAPSPSATTAPSSSVDPSAPSGNATFSTRAPGGYPPRARRRRRARGRRRVATRATPRRAG